MKTLLSAIACASGILFLGGFIPYIHSILRATRPTIPSKVSWTIWFTMDAVTFVGMYREHAINYVLLGALFGSSMVMLLSFRYGSLARDLTDFVSGILAAIATALLVTVHDPVWSLWLCAGGNFVGSWSVAKKVWSNPASEPALAWRIGTVACVLSLISLPRWSATSLIQPITFTLINGGLTLLLFVRSRMLAQLSRNEIAP